MFTSFDKALAAMIAAIVSMLVLWGLPVPAFMQDPTTQATIVTVITGIVTYLVPNKKPVA